MGYCPQFDALIEQLTAREMLTMFARLRGIRSDQVDRVVSSLLATLLLEEYADKQCGNYRYQLLNYSFQHSIVLCSH